MKKATTLGLALGFAVALAGTAQAQIKFGITGPITGPNAAFGAQLKNGAEVKIIDVREPHELAISHLEGSIDIPLGEIAGRLSALDTANEYVVLCRVGGRSARAVELMQAAGFGKVKNLVGGINAWAEQVDPDLPVY